METKELLGLSTFAGDADLQGDAVKANDYYNQNHGRHTLYISTDGFVGTISVEATISTDPNDDDWVEVDFLYDGISIITNNDTFTYTGNFVWMRVKLTHWTAGTINSITLSD